MDPIPPLSGRGTASNPPNRFQRLHVLPDPEDPDRGGREGGRPETRFLRDASRSIISRNRSPDVGFNLSLNPYRGCEHGCSYCMSGETPILMGDGTLRSLAEIRVGDTVYGTRSRGGVRRYVRTSVLDHWTVIRWAYRVTLGDGTRLITSGDHRFLSDCGWRHVAGGWGRWGRGRRRHLISGDQLMGPGGSAPGPSQSLDATPGCPGGIVQGEGHPESHGHTGPQVAHGYHRPGVGTAPVEVEARDPYISRKGDVQGRSVEGPPGLRVVSVEPLHLRLPLFDITTETGDFVASGVVSHNCYARPGHEYLGFSAGLDFETRVVVKEAAPVLLRKALSSPRWKPETLVMSGVTDPYQPVERRLGITRGCLEVLAEARHPVGVITKNHGVVRDLDLLGELAAHGAAAVTLSITTLDRKLQGILEPRTSTPERRLEAIRALSRAGIPVGVNVAPVIPGLTDHEMPAILEAAAEAGAVRAGWIMLRLPLAVAPLFEAWLEAHRPQRKEKVLNRLRSLRGGALYRSGFGVRMRGEGPYAEQVARVFEVTTRRLGLNRGRSTPLSTAAFRRPEAMGGEGGGRQLELFG